MANAILTQCVGFFGTSDITISDNGPGFTVAEVLTFRRCHNVTLQAIMPGHCQSLGATEWRHRYFNDITQRIIDG